eukprot:TRINITY_DN2355_c0_g1_i1.p1 TRINITY_DN2355_c0_g1~~TRINITY_DN2355_c0_g1_i1.p1  ORF type:complete len:420 (-),score=112.26 TRINITY_DN2355_c0_g1_i1:24-1283(-)
MKIKAEILATKGGEYIRDGCVQITDSTITSISSSSSSHLSNHSSGHSNTSVDEEEVHEAYFACPGFVEIHCHGLGGCDEMLEYWIHDYSFEKLPAYGTTSVVASVTFPADLSTSARVIASLERRVKHTSSKKQTRVMGIHAEGPIIVDLGGLPHLHPEMSVEEFKKILDMMPSLKIMTISPSIEHDNGYTRLRVLLERGITPALGHDKTCSELHVLGALRVCSEYKVVPHITHLFNVSSFNHRLPSLVNFGLVESYPHLPDYAGLPVPTIEIVADMVHIHPLTFGAVLAGRKRENIACITDAVLDSAFHVGYSCKYSGTEIELVEHEGGGRKVVLKGTNTIAGSCSAQIQIFQSLMKVFKIPPEQAVTMLSEAPAKITKIDDVVGAIEVGKRGDVLLFDKDFNLIKTIIAGHVAWSSSS